MALTEWQQERKERIVLALDGLLPLLAMDPTVSQFPVEEERERVVEKLVLADALVAGGAPSGSLTAVARAVHWLAGQPGGMKLFDGHYVRNEHGEAVRHAFGGCERCKSWRWREGE